MFGKVSASHASKHHSNHSQHHLKRNSKKHRRNDAFPSLSFGSVDCLSQLSAKGSYKHIFKQIDKNQNGTLDKNEFMDCTRALNLSLNDDEIARVFNSISDDGVITLKGFTKFIDKSVEMNEKYKSLQHAFHSTISQKQTLSDPLFSFTFDERKITAMFPILFDENKNNAFIGRPNSQLHIRPNSQILKVNSIDCEDVGYDKIIDIIEQSTMPQTILFREMPVTMFRDQSRSNLFELSDASDDNALSSADAHLEEEELYIVRSSQSPTPIMTLDHCSYCPNNRYLLIIHLTFEDEQYSLLSYMICTYVMILIIVATISYILETVPSLQQMDIAMEVFNTIEWIVSISFTIEYFVRIACVGGLGRRKYFFDAMNMIDFLAVVPFWIEMVAGSSGANILRVIRVVRLARVIRLMKSETFSDFLMVFVVTLKRSSESFGLLGTLITLQVILFGSLFYVIEAGEPNNWFSSIPIGCFFTVVTVTTAGYGDIYPLTVLGRIVAVICMFCGLLVVALPVIIIGGNFQQVFNEYIQEKNAQRIQERSKDKSNLADIGFHQIHSFLQNVNEKCQNDIFDFVDTNVFYQQGINSKERLEALLLNDKGYAFYPNDISKFKVFVLHEMYGAHFRRKHNKTRQKNLF